MRIKEAYSVINEFVEKIADPDKFDFDEVSEILKKTVETLKQYPEMVKYVDSDFIRGVQKNYCGDFSLEYTQLFIQILKNKNPEDQKFYVKEIENINSNLRQDFEEYAISENPELIDTIFDMRLKRLQTEPIGPNTNPNLMSLVIKAPTAEKCEQLLDCAFDEKVPFICRQKNLYQMEGVYQKFPQIIDKAFEHIKHYKDCPYFFAALTDIALFDDYKAEEVLYEMHQRIQRGPVDESLLQKYYEKMKVLSDALPRFKSMAQEFCREALSLPQNSKNCKKAAARLLEDEKSLSSQINIGKEVKKTKTNKFGYQQVDNIDDEETCILFIGGNGTINDKAAHGYIKSAISLLKEHHLSKDVNVYALAYDLGDYFNTEQALDAQMKKYGHKTYHREENLENMHEDTKDPQFIEQIFNKFILPRISTLDGKVKIEAAEAARKMNKLKLVAHCFGGYVSLKLEEMGLKKMADLGYTKNEQNLIQGQLQILAMNPYCPLGVQKSEMFSIISAQDREVQHNNFFEKYIRKIVSKGKIIPLCYFEKKFGNFVLVNRMYGSDNRYTPQLDKDEHNYFGFRILPAHSEKGRIAITFMQNYLLNGIKSALKNEIRTTETPQLLIKTKKDACNFAIAKENAELLYNEMVAYTFAENNKLFAKKLLTNKKE